MALYQKLTEGATLHVGGSKGPVVVIMGFTGLGPRIASLTYFKKRGFETYVINFGFQTWSVEYYRERLRKFVEDKHLKNVTFVGFSMGGIIATSYSQNSNWKNTKKVITVVSPFYGSDKTWLAPLSSGAKDLAVGSKMLSDIRKSGAPRGKLVSVFAAWDDLVYKNGVGLKNSKVIKLEVGGHVRVQRMKYLKPVFEKYIR